MSEILKESDIVVIGDWGVENYGANISYYALYKTILDMGLEPLMVERTIDAPWKPKTRPTMFKEIPYNDSHLYKYRNNRMELKELNNCAQVFLVGSDQLFNSGLYHAFGKIVNLSWVNANKRKIVYGASFGSTAQIINEKDRAELQLFLGQFDFVSVREQQAKEFMDVSLALKSECVMDPVFLCDESVFAELAKKAGEKYVGRYVSAYILEPSIETIKVVEEIAQELGCASCISTDALYDFAEVKKQPWGENVIEKPFVEEWLAQIYYSDFVVTDSFHATCLAIILHKPFVVLMNNKRGNDRFFSLTEILQLQNRLFGSIDQFRKEFDIIKQPIDYESVDKIISRKADESKRWLKNAIFSKINPKAISPYDILDERCDQMAVDESIYRNLVEEHFRKIEQSCAEMDIEEKQYRNLVEEHFMEIEKGCSRMDEEEKEYRGLVENHFREIEQSCFDMDEEEKQYRQLVENHFKEIEKTCISMDEEKKQLKEKISQLENLVRELMKRIE